ncbi:MAG: fumarylacetoacetate hydrolase family protein [Chloroflexota bacterium]|nr:fumarylacetoacetate hydrolase family protein [Chloroflexota bacterium]
MKLVSYEVQTALGRWPRIGALAHGTIVDLTSAAIGYFAETRDANAARRHAEGLIPPDMIGFLEGGAASRDLADRAVEYVATRLRTDARPLGPQGQRLTFSESEIRWLAPVPRPPMVRDGILILEHYRRGMGRLLQTEGESFLPEYARKIPIYWKPSRTVVRGHKEPILWPKYSKQLDYEFEIGMYIGRRGKDIPVESAWEYVAGFTIFQDMCARDIQPAELTFRVGTGKAKDFDGSKVMGPCLVTIDELPNPEDLRLTTRVNGEIWFEGSFSGWAFTYPQLIAHVSQAETIEVGDFFGSGPPAGSCGFELGKWIKPGDVIEAEVPGIGILSNQVISA